MTIFQKESVVLSVSGFDENGYWTGNSEEHVAKGTALGSEFTETLYTPSDDGMTGKYDAETDAWTEIEDMTAAVYYDTYGNSYTVGSPEGEYPDGAVLTEPPEYDSESEFIRYENDEWVTYTNHFGKVYYNSEGKELTVTEFVFTLPDDCTFTAPPDAEDNTVYLLEDGEWVLYNDYRGETVYSTDDMSKSTVDYYGDIANGYTLTAPSTEYDYWDDDSGTWVTDTDAQTEAETQATNKVEYNWAASQIQANGPVEVALAQISDGDSRGVGTEAEWRVFRMACRDYASYDSESGEYSIADVSENTYTYDGIEYTVFVDDDGRPISPNNKE